MKELYIAPELNVVCFAPVERLALSFDDLLDVGGMRPQASRDGDGDIDLDL